MKTTKNDWSNKRCKIKRSKELLEKILFIADPGSAEELGDALERVKGITEIIKEAFPNLKGRG